MSGFKNFIMRGNLVELAVAVVIGTPFGNRALPGVHRADHVRHRAAPAGRPPALMFTPRIYGKLCRDTI